MDFFDSDCAKLVSIDGDIEIYPVSDKFNDTKNIYIEVNGESITVPVDSIDDLIDGLRLAKKQAL